jgi:hypothetical protein
MTRRVVRRRGVPRLDELDGHDLLWLEIGLPPRLRDPERVARLRALWQRFGPALLVEAQLGVAPWALATFGDPTPKARS